MTEKKSCWILSFMAAMVYMASALFLWHPYYCINDDYIIRDILSGRFSGVADAHIYNVIYPFAYLLKILYEITKRVDVWGGGIMAFDVSLSFPDFTSCPGKNGTI